MGDLDGQSRPVQRVNTATLIAVGSYTDAPFRQQLQGILVRIWRNSLCVIVFQSLLPFPHGIDYEFAGGFTIFVDDLFELIVFNGKSLKDFDIAPFVIVAPNDDLAAAFDSLRPWLALYIGGMGAKGKNFYHDYATRLGYGDVATRIQELYLSGKKEEATALVPNELLDEVSLVGSHGRIVERLAAWKEAGKRGEIGTMLLSVANPAILELFAKEFL